MAGNFVTVPLAGVQVQSPGGGPGGEAPGSYWVFSDSKCLLTCLVAPTNYCYSVSHRLYLLNQLY